MKRKLCALICALTLTAAGAMADHAVEPTPEESFAAAPRAEFYTESQDHNYATGYEDPTLKITMTEGRYLDTTWIAARIKVAYPNQLRACMSGDRYGSSSAVPVTKNAEMRNAILAINDDWFMSQYRVNIGAVIRQGVTYRMRCRGNYDILGIDDKGDFHVFPNAQNEDLESFPGTLINAFVFGPGIVLDGKAQPVPTDNHMGAFHQAQRMGIGQIGPLEYICVCCEGPEDPGSRGLTVQEFGELVASFGDVWTFYNLDGGSSSSMVFKGVNNRGQETFWAKINAQQNRKVRTSRETGGAIYFTSAWVPDEAASETTGAAEGT